MKLTLNVITLCMAGVSLGLASCATGSPGGSVKGEAPQGGAGFAGACDWRLEEGEAVHADHPRDPKGEERHTAQLMELDGAAPSDAIAALGLCGSWGDCMFVVLQGCAEGGLRAVWGPEYAQGLQVRSVDPASPSLWLLGRTAEAGCDLPLRTALTWDGSAWQAGATCALEGVWDDAACGARPPACAP